MVAWRLFWKETTNITGLFVCVEVLQPSQPNGVMSTGLLVAHFENIGFYVGSSYSKYRLFTGFSKKNIG